MAWLRTQPRSRVVLWGALGTGAVIALVLGGIFREPPPEVLPVAEPEGWADAP